MSLSKGMASRVIFPRFLMMMQLSISAILSVTIIARREDRRHAGEDAADDVQALNCSP